MTVNHLVVETPRVPLRSPAPSMTSSRDPFHAMSPIVHDPHSPDGSETNRDRFDSAETFTPAAVKTTMQDIESIGNADSVSAEIVAARSPFPLKAKPKSASPLSPIHMSMAAEPPAPVISEISHVTTCTAVPAPSTNVVYNEKSSSKMVVILGLAVLAVMSSAGIAVGFMSTGSYTSKAIPSIQFNPMDYESFITQPAVEMNSAVFKASYSRAAEQQEVLQNSASGSIIKSKHSPSLVDFGMFEDIIEPSVGGQEEQRRSIATSSGAKQPFGPRGSAARPVAIFKSKTFQMFSDSIQSQTVNDFVNILRQLYRRIKELNLLKRFDLFIRGVVLSVVNSGQERIPPQNI